MKTQLTKSKKFTTFLKTILTHLIRFFLSLISRTSLTIKENYPSLKYTRMIKGRLCGKHTTFQMVRMMIDGITGALLTGVQSGMFQSSTLNMRIVRFWNLLLVLRGVHPKELLKSCVKSIQTYHSLVSMMNQDVRLQDTIRTV